MRFDKTLSKSFLGISASSVLLLGACTMAGSQSASSEAAPAMTPEDYAALGLEAAELFPGLTSLCDLDMVFRNVNVPRSQRRAQATPTPVASASEHAHEAPAPAATSTRRRAPRLLPPMQVFDDLYFIGNGGVAAWLVGSEEDGYVLFDALNSNAEAERDIIGGMEALGLDPSKIRHFIVSHGHGDHYGGHRFLSERLDLPVTMSAPDIALAQSLGEHPRFGPPPQNVAEIADGTVIELGDTKINIYVTSAHTPGTISPIITVHDNGVAHRLIMWGGTGMNFGADEAQLRRYAASAARLRDLSEQQGVDGFISNHPARDGSNTKMALLADRQDGDPHPFVMGTQAQRVFDVFENCPLAQAERIATGRYAEETGG